MGNLTNDSVLTLWDRTCCDRFMYRLMGQGLLLFEALQNIQKK
jgi:hypothetical protein